VAQTGTFVNVDAASSLTVGDTDVGFDITAATSEIDSSHSTTVSGAAAASTVKYATDATGITNAFGGTAIKVFYSGTDPIPTSVLTSARTIVVTSPNTDPVAQNAALTVAGTLIVNPGAKITTSSAGAITVSDAATSILTNNGTIVAATAITQTGPTPVSTINGSGTWLATATAGINSLFALFDEVTAATGADGASADITVSGAAITIPKGKTLVVTGGNQIVTSTNLELGAGRYTVSSVGTNDAVAINYDAATFTITGDGATTLTVGSAEKGIIIGKGTGTGVWTAGSAVVTFGSAVDGTATASTATGTFSVNVGAALTIGEGSTWTVTGNGAATIATLTGKLTNNGTIDLQDNAGTINTTGGTVENNGLIKTAVITATPFTSASSITNNGIIETATATNTVILALIAGPTGSGKIVLKGDANGSLLASAAALTQNIEIASTGQLAANDTAKPFTNTAAKTITIKTGGKLLLGATTNDANDTLLTIKNNGTIESLTVSTDVLQALMEIEGDTATTARTVASTGNVVTIANDFTVPQYVTLTTVTGGTFAGGAKTVTVDGTWTSAGGGITLAAATALEVNGTLTTGADFAPAAALGTGATAFTGTGHLDIQAVSNPTAVNLTKFLGIAKVTATTNALLTTALVVPGGSELDLVDSAITLANSDSITVNGTLTLSGTTALTLLGVASTPTSEATITGTYAAGTAAATINIGDGGGAIKATGKNGVDAETGGAAALTISGVTVNIEAADAILATGGNGAAGGQQTSARKGGAGAIIIIESDALVNIPVTPGDYISAIGGNGGIASTTGAYAGGGGGGGAVIISNGKIYQNGARATANTVEAASAATGGSVKVGQGAHAGLAAAAAGGTASGNGSGIPTGGADSSATAAGAGGESGANNSGSATPGTAATGATYAGGGGGGSGTSGGGDTSGAGGGGGAAIKLTA
jgi:hypothetical protein